MSARPRPFLRRLASWASARSPLLAGAGLALAILRAFVELGSLVSWPAGALGGAAVGLITGGLAGRGLARRFDLRTDWPVVLLWAYVLYPRFAPGLGLLAGLAAGITWLQARRVVPAPILVDFAVFAAALALYTSTLAPGVLPADGGEFQVVALRLGVAHPPGYPLYTLLGHVFTRLLPGDPLKAVNLFSAAAAALTVALTGRAARRLGGGVWGGLIAAALLAVAVTFWQTATRASVRPLTAFFTALCVERLAAFRADRREGALRGFALAFGLGVTHHPSLIFPGMGFATYLLLIEPDLIRQPRRWPTLAGCFALGFTPWLYLVVGGMRGAPLAPNGLATWSGFWAHVLARGFQGDVLAQGGQGSAFDLVEVWANILWLQWGAAPLLIIAAGLIALGWRRWRALVLLAAGALALSAAAMTYRAPQTSEYLVPVYLLLATAAGAGLGGLTEEGFRPALRAAGMAGLGAALAAGLALGANRWPSLRAVDDSIAAWRDALALLEDAPPGALVLADWHHATPLWALQAAEGLRPDVMVGYVNPVGTNTPAQTWLARIEEASTGASGVVVTRVFPTQSEGTPTIYEPLDAGWRVRSEPRRDLPADMARLSAPFDNGLTLVGATRPPESIGAGRTFALRLAWRVDEAMDHNVTGFVHLVGPGGEFLSGWDAELPAAGAEAGDILVGAYTVGLPVDQPPGEVQVMAGAYHIAADGTLVSGRSDGELRVPVGVVEAVPPRWPAPTASPLRVRFGNGARLVGVDREGDTVYLHTRGPDGTPRTVRTAQGAEQAALENIAAGGPWLGPWAAPVTRPVRLPPAMPGGRYVPLGGRMILIRAHVRPEAAPHPGGTVRTEVTLLGTRPLQSDNVIKLEVEGADGAWVVPSEGVPAEGAIPTLKWLWGWQVVDERALMVPVDAPTPAAGVTLLVYDRHSGQRLVILDPRLAEAGITVGLADWTP